jgi:hypothetical protein
VGIDYEELAPPIEREFAHPELRRRLMPLRARLGRLLRRGCTRLKCGATSERRSQDRIAPRSMSSGTPRAAPAELLGAASLGSAGVDQLQHLLRDL